MEEQKELKVIDLYGIARKIWTGKKLFAKTLPIAFVLACIFILGFPRYYTTDVKLAPELDGPSVSGSLGSLASSFGFDLENFQNNDAITPLLYPDLMEDNGFVINLFQVKIVTKGGHIKTTYHDYLQKYQQPSWWTMPFNRIKLLFKEPDKKGSNKYDPYNISKEESELADVVRKNIDIKFDKKTGIITINVTDQDPLVCKTMADSVKEHLQLFITEYRTNKARTDYKYYQNLASNAKREYEKVRQTYANMADATTNVVLRSIELKMEDMENDLQLKFNAYTTINTQLQAAKARVQERTPAFTTIKGAAVPVKPAGPKRMVFVAICLLLTFIVTGAYVYTKVL